MKQVYLSIFLCLLAGVQAVAKIFPEEGSTINFRLVCFRFSTAPDALDTRLEIAEGNIREESVFNSKKIIDAVALSGKSIIELPTLGTTYTWRIKTNLANGKKIKTIFYHFNTGTIPEIDTSKFKVSIVHPLNHPSDLYFFCDATKALYNFSGQPVWYLPAEKWGSCLVRDLNLTPQGTITFVVDEKGVYEVNFEGEVLWEGPNNGIISGDKQEHYHHEFTRLRNGHYMALGQKFIFAKRPITEDEAQDIEVKNTLNDTDKSSDYERLPMATLIEYDVKGKVVWSWTSSSYFHKFPYFFQKTEGHINPMPGHENAFFFDEKRKDIYLSCRNLNKIVKIKYPKGTVTAEYSGVSADSGIIFCGQHSCKVTEDGLLYLYNNNVCQPGAYSTAILMKETPGNTQKLHKIWEYTCLSDTTSPRGYPSGGNIMVLPDEKVFISMAYPESKLLLVDKNKNLIWSAKIQKRIQNNAPWEPVNIYRASLIANTANFNALICHPVRNK